MNSSLLGIAARRPKIWVPLTQNIDMVLGAQRAGTHVRNSNALYTDPTTGLITTVGNNIPRHERKGGLLALLDEPAGTNLIHFSHELGNVASTGWWTNTRLTSVTANGEIGPDGTAAADGLVADVNDNIHMIISPAIAGVAQNDKVVLTAFSKPGNKDWVMLSIGFYDAGASLQSGSYYFNVATGTIGTKTEGVNITVHDYKIESAANSFYRIGIIASINDANVDNVLGRLVSAHTDNDVTFPGDTATVNTWLWGADLKKQAYFDSHVPTSGATATRATESGYPLWSLPLGLFDAEGTLSVWWRPGYSRANGGATNSGIVSSSDGAPVLLYAQAGNTRLTTRDGVNTVTKTLDWSANTWYKLAVKWSSTTGKMSIGIDSGSGVSWSTEGTFDGSYALGTNLRLGNGLFGPMWLRDLRLYDRVLSDAEINNLGSPP